MFGRRKAVPPRGVEIVKDRGEFRPGLYDRDMHELRVALGRLDQKMDSVLANQVKLDELMRKVGLVTEREARAVKKALAAMAEIEKTITNVKNGVGERLDEAVNQIVASQQDIIGWLRRLADKAAAGRQGKDEASLTEEGRPSKITGRAVAEELRQVIQMLVAGETAKAVEVLSTIYSRLAPDSEENPYDAPAAAGGVRKRTAGLRSSWQVEKGERSSEE